MQGADALSFEVQPTCVANDLSLTLINISGEPGVPFEIKVYKKATGVLVETIQRPSISATATEFLEYQNHTFLRNADDYRLQLVQTNPATNCEINSPFVDVVVPNEVFALIGVTEKSYPDIANGSLEVTNISGGVTPYQVRIELDSAASFNFPDFQTNFSEPDLNSNNQFGKKFDNVPPGRYVIQVMDEVGCVLELMARVKMDQEVYIPNIFTPNGDNVNDLFFIRNLPVDNAELIVTSRWGKEVFSTKNYQNNWDGKGAADGVYFYQLSIGGSEAITGWVEILRGEKP
jgi:gliding motility-associated-like protein